jgi:hypothetical protein
LETLRLIDTYRISREEMNIFLLSIKNWNRMTINKKS